MYKILKVDFGLVGYVGDLWQINILQNNYFFENHKPLKHALLVMEMNFDLSW